MLQLLVRDYRSEILENNVLCIYVFKNHNDNGIEGTYCCSFGKSELYSVLSSTRNQRVIFVSRNISLVTPWSTVQLEKLTGSQLVKKFPAFYGTRRFNTAFTSARHLSLS